VLEIIACLREESLPQSVRQGLYPNRQTLGCAMSVTPSVSCEDLRMCLVCAMQCCSLLLLGWHISK
jgi:hypothetical protein